MSLVRIKWCILKMCMVFILENKVNVEDTKFLRNCFSLRCLNHPSLMIRHIRTYNVQREPEV